MGDDRRRRIALAEQRVETARRQHFRGGQGKFAAQKTRVVAKDDERLPIGDRGARVSEF